jgi:purine-binding chemotaxis protein CheW
MNPSNPNSNSRKITKKPVTTALMRLQFRQMQNKAKHNLAKRLAKVANSPSLDVATLEDKAKEETRLLLQQRAAELAQPIAPFITDTIANTLVILKNNNCQMALNVGYVREIIPLEGASLVPGVPAFIVGVINWRGNILTLVNIEIFLRQGSSRGYTTNAPAVQKQSVVLVESDGFDFGLLCEDFPTIRQQAVAEFSPVASSILDYSTDYLIGVNADGVLLLDLPKVIASSSFLVNQE